MPALPLCPAYSTLAVVKLKMPRSNSWRLQAGDIDWPLSQMTCIQIPLSVLLLASESELCTQAVQFLFGTKSFQFHGP